MFLKQAVKKVQSISLYVDGTKGHRMKNKLNNKMKNKMKLTLKFFIINVRIKGMSFGYLPNNHPNLIKAASHVMSKPLT